MANTDYSRTNLSKESTLQDDVKPAGWRCRQSLIAGERIRPPRRICEDPALPEGPHSAMSSRHPILPEKRECTFPNRFHTARGAAHNRYGDACRQLDALCEIETSSLLDRQTVSCRPGLRAPKT